MRSTGGCSFVVIFQDNAGQRRKQGTPRISVGGINGRCCYIPDALSGSQRMGWFYLLCAVVQNAGAYETYTFGNFRVLADSVFRRHLGTLS